MVAAKTSAVRAAFCTGVGNINQNNLHILW